MCSKNCDKLNNNGVLLVKTVVHGFFMTHHIISWLTLLWVFYQLQDKEDPKLCTVRNFPYAFLTNWNLAFQTLFLFLALCHDLLEWGKNHDSLLGHRIKYCRDVLFCGIVAPLTLFVSSFFWVVYTTDRELVFPAVYDTVFPFWANHCIHTNIAVLVLLETLLQPRRHPTDHALEIACVVVIELTYAILYHSIYLFANVWLYGINEILTWWQRCLLQLIIWISGFMFYRIQFPINRFFHPDGKTHLTHANRVVKEEFVKQNEHREHENSYSENSLNLKCRSTKCQ